MGRLVVVARGLYLARHLFTLCNDITCSHFGSNECKEIELHGRHKCAECDFVTIRLQDLKRHIERKHEGVIYRCEKCQYFSKSKYDLHIHRQSKHSNIHKKNAKITENKKNAKINVTVKREVEYGELEEGR